MMEGSMLGILITREAHLEHILGTATAARAANHPVSIFLTDTGVKLTQHAKFLDLLAVGGIDIAVCEYSCEREGVHGRVAGITYGSQYDHAGMLHHSARVLVF